MTLTVSIGETVVELYDEASFTPDVLNDWANVAVRILTSLPTVTTVDDDG